MLSDFCVFTQLYTMSLRAISAGNVLGVLGHFGLPQGAFQIQLKNPGTLWCGMLTMQAGHFHSPSPPPSCAGRPQSCKHSRQAAYCFGHSDSFLWNAWIFLSCMPAPSLSCHGNPAFPAGSLWMKFPCTKEYFKWSNGFLDILNKSILIYH